MPPRNEIELHWPQNSTNTHAILLLEQEEDSSRVEMERLGDGTRSTKKWERVTKTRQPERPTSVVGSPPDISTSQTEQRPKQITPNRQCQSYDHSTCLRNRDLHAPPRYISWHRQETQHGACHGVVKHRDPAWGKASPWRDTKTNEWTPTTYHTDRDPSYRSKPGEFDM